MNRKNILPRRCRFSIRSVVVFLAVAAVPLAYIANVRYEYRRQNRARLNVVEHFTKAGGGFISSPGYKWQVSRSSWRSRIAGDRHLDDIVGITLGARFDFVAYSRFEELSILDIRQALIYKANLPADKLFSALGKLPHLEEVYFLESQIDGADWKNISRCSGLRTLIFKYSDLHPSAFAQIAKLPHLEELSIIGGRMSDTDCDTLSRFSHLKTLTLWNTVLSRKGLIYISQIESLEYLDLDCTGADDSIVQYLVKLPRLQTVNIWRSNITAAGKSELEAHGVKVDD